jgi:hypothetical protein
LFIPGGIVVASGPAAFVWNNVGSSKSVRNTRGFEMTGRFIAGFRLRGAWQPVENIPNLGERGGIYAKSVNYIVPSAAPKCKRGRFGELRAAGSCLE